MRLANLTILLREHRLEYEALCDYQVTIQKLVRQITAGLLFETEIDGFFHAEVLPLISRLLKQLQQTYGTEHPQLQQLSSQILSSKLVALKDLFLSDINAALSNDPATNDALEIIFCYPGFKAICYHRVAHSFYQLNLPLLPRMIAELAHEQTGIDIHPGAQIGPQFFIDHGTGIVIGESVIIGTGVTLYQGVTLGAKRFARDPDGKVLKGLPRHPIIGDGVTIYAGATILGRITIGDYSNIGGNVWLTESIPARSRITQQRYLVSYFTDGDGI